jgi:hypothetical protein
LDSWCRQGSPFEDRFSEKQSSSQITTERQQQALSGLKRNPKSLKQKDPSPFLPSGQKSLKIFIQNFCHPGVEPQWWCDFLFFLSLF